MHLIAIAGRAGVGKDTVADYLCRKYDFAKFGMAWPLKAMLHTGLGLDPAEYQSGPQKEAIIPRFGFSYRKAAQTLGTEWGRGLRDDLWLLLAQYRIEWTKANLPKLGGIVCCDVRFENEAAMFRSQGGLVVHMDSKTLNPVTVGEQAEHVSEQGIDYQPGDAFMDNSYPLPQLFYMIDSMMAELPKQAVAA